MTETETKISGCSWERRLTTVPLPTAVGPETTVRRAGVTRLEAAWTDRRTRRSGPQSGACPTPQPAVGGDIEPFHHLAGTHRAHSRQCLQDIDDLGVRDDVVILGKVQHLGKAPLAGAESLLHLGAASSSLGRGMPCLLALLVAQGGIVTTRVLIWRPGVGSADPRRISRRFENLPQPDGCFHLTQHPCRGSLQASWCRSGRHDLATGGWQHESGRILEDCRRSAAVPPCAPMPGARIDPPRALKSVSVCPIVAPITTPTGPRMAPGLRRTAFRLAASSMMIWPTVRPSAARACWIWGPSGLLVRART